MFGVRSLVPYTETLVPANRDIFEPFLSFRREMDRIFDEFFRSSGLSLTAGEAWMPAPQLDLVETDEEYRVIVELPGVDPSDVTVEVRGDLLVVRGEKKAEQEEKAENRYVVERRFGRFERCIRLPAAVDLEKAEATYDKGVLTIRLPKPAEARKPVRKIEIKAAA
ncbi:Spore protein SP21 [bacterium HR40]|nr:Spore protein SP21 [bacterium HR40]